MIIIDVRDEQEYLISRIKNSQNIQSVQEIHQAYGNEKSIIFLYCSVGYRSGKIAEKLTKMGMKNVYNLKGSIFEWTNQGYEIVNDRGKSNYVHPYDEYWGQLLNQKFHKYTINNN
jgi:rhodanese-related sulfurtransferase